MKKLLSGMILTLWLGVLGCSSSNLSGPTPGPKKLGTFQSAPTCEEIQAYVEQYAQRARQNPGGVVPVESNGFSRGVSDNAAADSPVAPEAETGGGAVTQSDIAVADSVRGLLFTASSEQKLKVFRANPGNQAQEISHLALDFYPIEMLAAHSGNKDFLVLFGSTGGYYGVGPEPIPLIAVDGGGGAYEEPKFVMAVLDVSDPSHPTELKRETAPGSFLEGRSLPGKNAVLWVTQRWVGLDAEHPDPGQIFPEKNVTAPGASGTEPVAACGDTYLYQNDSLDPAYAPFTLTETVVSQLTLSDLGVASRAIFSPAYRTVIAANPQHLFLAQNLDLSGRPDSELFQFDLGSGNSSLNLSASGQVPGEIPNQFFIDEVNGSLRVFHHASDFSGGCMDCVSPGFPGGGGGAEPAAAIKAEASLATGNYLSIYQKSGDQLVQVGRSGPFETNEVPYAARFLGSIGCIITFQQIDPLTCFSLTDPSHPILLGSLQISGVSFHLEAITNDLLLGIGRGAGNGTVVANLFDIHDPAHPTLAQQKVLVDSGDYAYSPVFYDYRALGMDEAKRTFAIPIDTMSATTITFLAVAPETASLQSLGTIQKSNNGQDYDSYQRAYFFNDSLATVSLWEVEVFLRNNLNKVFSAPLN